MLVENDFLINIVMMIIFLIVWWNIATFTKKRSYKIDFSGLTGLSVVILGLIFLYINLMMHRFVNVFLDILIMYSGSVVLRTHIKRIE